MDETQAMREAEAQYELSEAVSQVYALGFTEEEIVARVRAIIAHDERLDRPRPRGGVQVSIRE